MKLNMSSRNRSSPRGLTTALTAGFSLPSLCMTSLKILSEYYDFQSCIEIDDFILPESQNEQDSKVLFQETENDFFIGVQFEKEVFDEIKFLQTQAATQKTKYISLNTAGIIAEEISHFKLILDVFQNQKRISLINLETLGEIDRFLCLMHWNQKNNFIKINHTWQNIHDICDYLFLGTRFKENINKNLYENAEGYAFFHIKNAFRNEWDCTWYNFSKFNLFAAEYFQKLRGQVQIGKSSWNRNSE